MNVKNTQDMPSSMDKIKWILVVVLLIAGIVFNYYFSEMAVSIRIMVWLVLVGLMVALAVTTSRGKSIVEFAQESRSELRKVVWPSRQETMQTALLVIALVVVMSIFLWGIDSFFLWAVSWLTGQRG